MLPKNKKPIVDENSIQVDYATPSKKRYSRPYTYEGATGNSVHGEPARVARAGDTRFVPEFVEEREEEHDAYKAAYVDRWTKNRI